MTETDAETVRLALDILADLLRARDRAPDEMHVMGLKEAAFVADISESRLRLLCSQNVRGLRPGGYGYRKRDGAPWEVEVLPFLVQLPLALVPRFLETRTSREILSAE